MANLSSPYGEVNSLTLSTVCRHPGSPIASFCLAPTPVLATTALSPWLKCKWEIFFNADIVDTPLSHILASLQSNTIYYQMYWLYDEEPHCFIGREARRTRKMGQASPKGSEENCLGWPMRQLVHELCRTHHCSLEWKCYQLLVEDSQARFLSLQCSWLYWQETFVVILYK